MGPSGTNRSHTDQGWCAVIVVTRLNGGMFGVNPDLILRVDSAPDTILTLIDGTKLIVEESLDEVIARVNEHRSRVLARSREIQQLSSDTASRVPHAVRDTAADDDDDPDDPPATSSPLRRVR